jgi:heme/copper-type cytochrome/quinol oxidase subunit 4
MRYVPYALLIILTFIPLWKIIKRTGSSPWWLLLSLPPLGMLIALWVFAYKAWPMKESKNV